MAKILPISEVKARLAESNPDLMTQIHASREHVASEKRWLDYENAFGEPLHPKRKRGRR